MTGQTLLKKWANPGKKWPYSTELLEEKSPLGETHPTADRKEVEWHP